MRTSVRRTRPGTGTASLLRRWRWDRPVRQLTGCMRLLGCRSDDAVRQLAPRSLRKGRRRQLMRRDRRARRRQGKRGLLLLLLLVLLVRLRMILRRWRMRLRREGRERVSSWRRERMRRPHRLLMLERRGTEARGRVETRRRKEVRRRRAVCCASRWGRWGLARCGRQRQRGRCRSGDRRSRGPLIRRRSHLV